MSVSKRYLPPPFILSKVINPFLIKLKLIPFLTLRGRKSGKLINTPVSPVEYKGDTYLVAPRGETQWVRNLRVAKQGTITMKRKPLPFKATEVTGKLHDDVVSLYRKKVRIAEAQFKEIPTLSDHPTFRLTW